MRPSRADAVVIGAGAAGLASAAAMTRAGLRVILLEARGRLGGRVHTLDEPDWPIPVERGAEFVHGRPPETWELLAGSRALPYETGGETWLVSRGRRRRGEEEREGISRVLDRLAATGPADMSFRSFLRRACGDLPAKDRAAAARYVEGFDAADTRRVSALSLRAEEEGSEALGGDRLFRLAGGYARVVSRLAAGIDPGRLELRLGWVATRLRWRPGEVEVESRSFSGAALEPVTARCAVLAVPLGVLQTRPGQTGALRLSPDLPAKRRALSRLRMGAVVKLVLLFEESFWERRLPDRMSFLHLPGEPFPTWWTPAPLLAPVLTGWAGGPAAGRLSGRTEEELVGRGVASLGRALGLPRRRLESRLRGWRVCDWAADPFARGAYGYVLTGGLAAQAELAAPVDGTLHFAGEATQGGLGGTVAAAIASGYRAAREAVRGADLEELPS